MQQTYLIALSSPALAELPFAVCAIRATTIQAAARRLLQALPADQIDQHFTMDAEKKRVTFAQTPEAAQCLARLLLETEAGRKIAREDAAELADIVENMMRLVYPQKKASFLLYEVCTIDVFDADDIIV